MRLGLVVGLAALIKVIVWWQLHDHLLLQPTASPDSEAYFTLATRVIAGDWALGPGGYFVSPLYIYVLAVLFGLSKSLATVTLVQVALGALGVGLIWWTAREWFGDRTATLSAILAIFTGLFTFYEVTLTQASLDPFITAASMASLTAALLRPNHRWSLLAGVAFGVAVANRPNILLAIALIVIALIAIERWKSAALVGVGVVLTLLPVGVRNGMVTGEWSLLPSHGGLNFLIGNAAEAHGLYRPLPGIRSDIRGQAVDARRIAEAARGRALSDSDVSAYFVSEASAWIRSEPTRWGTLMATKTYYTLHGQHFAVPLSYPFFARDTGSLLVLLAVGPWILVGLGSFGLWRSRPSPARREYLAWALFVPGVVLSVAIFFVAERYRLPMFVPLVIGSGAALDHLSRLVAQRRWTPLMRDLGLVGFLVVALNLPLDFADADGRLEERVKMAEVLARADRTTEAEQWLARALPRYPYQEAAHYRVATILAERNQHAAAVRQLAQAALVSDDVTTGNAEIWLQAGRLAIRLKAMDEAVALFRRAVSIEPDATPARDQLGLALLLTGDLAGATEQFTRVVAADPRNVDALAHLAYAAANLGQRVEAADYASRALAIDSGHQLARQVLAAVK